MFSPLPAENKYINYNTTWVWNNTSDADFYKVKIRQGPDKQYEQEKVLEMLPVNQAV